MYLTENAKKMLDAAIASYPTLQNRFYLATSIAHEFGVNNPEEAKAIAVLLEKEGAVTLWEADRNCFQLTELGRNYKKYHWWKTKEYFKQSILCPIVVTLLTELALHALPALWRWMQALE